MKYLRKMKSLANNVRLNNGGNRTRRIFGPLRILMKS